MRKSNTLERGSALLGLKLRNTEMNALSLKCKTLLSECKHQHMYYEARVDDVIYRLTDLKTNSTADNVLEIVYRLSSR